MLNDFEHLKVTIQYEPQSPTSLYHYIFSLKFNDEEIENIIRKFQKEMKSSWYAFFWNESKVNIVFDKNSFQINLADGWTSDEAKKAVELGKSEGIPEEYLDFEKHFQPYKEMISQMEEKSDR